MGNIGPMQLLLIALIILLIFGAGRIAEIGKGLGSGIKNFKKGLRDEDDDDPKQLKEKKKSDDDKDD
jgi:sec-independent protein translocase protein TatA